MTLRWRIALILAAVALLVGAFAALASYLTTASQLQGTIDDTLRSRATEVNTVDTGDHDGRGGRGDAHGLNDTGCANAGSFQPASAAQLVSTTGVVTSCITGGPTLPVTEHERSLASGRVELRTVDIDGARFRMLSTPWHDGGLLQIARSLGESDALLSRLRLRLMLLVAAAVAVAAALGWAVATRLARPIARLRDATHRMATTLDLTTPIDVRATGEVGSLAASFATMVDAVRHSQQQQQRLVSDASHEMRTPLTSLRSNMELLERIDRL
ncbi:MAG: HAMP domain-containing protein, partial [Acidimicrobiia bacterium]|nr:HAMP domain-containing protein [Acidimicrobiia bacterium]